MLHHPSAMPAEQERVVAKAVIRAAEKLALTGQDLAQVIGVSPAKVSRMKSGETADLAATGKPFELAVLLIRLFRSLDAITGGDESVARAWMRNPNTALNGTPADLIKTVPGLMAVIAYLDARRAIV